jgi:hypothetical protein
VEVLPQGIEERKLSLFVGGENKTPCRLVLSNCVFSEGTEVI